MLFAPASALARLTLNQMMREDYIRASRWSQTHEVDANNSSSDACCVWLGR
jgi:hypothetical protein